MRVMLSGIAGVACLALAACGDGGGSADVGGSGQNSGNMTSPAPPAATATQDVGVSGTHLTLNGSPWLSRGITLRAFDSTPSFAQASRPSQYHAYQVADIARLVEEAETKSAKRGSYKKRQET